MSACAHERIPRHSVWAPVDYLATSTLPHSLHPAIAGPLPDPPSHLTELSGELRPGRDLGPALRRLDGRVQPAEVMLTLDRVWTTTGRGDRRRSHFGPRLDDFRVPGGGDRR